MSSTVNGIARTAAAVAIVFNINALFRWNHGADAPELKNADDRELSFIISRSAHAFPLLESTNDVRTVRIDPNRDEWCDETHFDGNILTLPFYSFSRACRPMTAQDADYVIRHFPNYKLHVLPASPKQP